MDIFSLLILDTCARCSRVDREIENLMAPSACLALKLLWISEEKSRLRIVARRIYFKNCTNGSFYRPNQAVEMTYM